LHWIFYRLDCNAMHSLVHSIELQPEKIVDLLIAVSNILYHLENVESIEFLSYYILMLKT